MVETFILLFFLLTEIKDGLLIVVVQIYDEERFKLLTEFMNQTTGKNYLECYTNYF